MGGSYNDPNLAKEWRNPGLQATQPLADGQNHQDALSSTENLQGDFFGEGGLGALLKKSLGNDPIPNYDTTGGGFGSFNPESGNAPFMPVAPTGSRSNSGLSNGSNSSSGSWTNAGMGGASNSGNFLGDISNSLGNMGGIFNTNFSSFNTAPEGGINNTSWTASNSLFSNKSLLGSYLSKDAREGLGTLGLGTKVAGAFGYGNSNLNNALSIAGASPRSLVNAYAGYTNNAALGMLTGDFSQRGIVNTALQQSGIPYGGSIMGLADYGMGYNNYGALGSTIGGMFGPVGSAIGSLFGHNLQGYYGDPKDATTEAAYNESYLSKYNDNYGTYDGDVAANQYARDFGLEPGTHEFDRAVDGFKVSYSKNEGFRDWYGKNYPEPIETPITYPYIDSVDEAIKQGMPFGKEGDDTWTDGTTTFHSGGYNWNGTTNTGSDSFGNDISSGGTDVTGATASDYSSYDSPSESSGPDGGDGTSDSSDDPGGDDDDAGGWSW